eukprot:5315994-Pleurochrysis_carterae.AAC.1
MLLTRPRADAHASDIVCSFARRSRSALLDTHAHSALASLGPLFQSFEKLSRSCFREDQARALRAVERHRRPR